MMVFLVREHNKRDESYKMEGMSVKMWDSCINRLSPLVSQMHHPIQMKPADSEKTSGKWIHGKCRAVKIGEVCIYVLKYRFN